MKKILILITIIFSQKISAWGAEIENMPAIYEIRYNVSKQKIEKIQLLEKSNREEIQKRCNKKTTNKKELEKELFKVMNLKDKGKNKMNLAIIKYTCNN